jgi:hypothetical protein
VNRPQNLVHGAGPLRAFTEPSGKLVLELISTLEDLLGQLTPYYGLDS